MGIGWFRMDKKRQENIKNSTIRIAVFAILIALQVVIAQFLTIHTEILKITLSFIPVVIAGRLFGPLGAGLIAGIGDFLQAFMFPVGAWFPPITLTSIAVGMIFGFFFKNGTSITRVIISVLITELIISMFITPIWLYMLQGTDYWLLVFSRLPQICVMIIVKMVIIPPTLKITDKINFFQKKKIKA